jgi:hypothetical protein
MTIFERAVEILEGARRHVSRSVNTAMVRAYWLIGREIVEVEQRGRERAGYGDRLVEGLARRLSERFGRGFSVPNVRNMRQFYLAFPDGSALPEAPGGPQKRLALPSGSGRAKIRSAPPSDEGAR